MTFWIAILIGILLGTCATVLAIGLCDSIDKADLEYENMMLRRIIDERTS
jgi:hypothetical protein